MLSLGSSQSVGSVEGVPPHIIPSAPNPGPSNALSLSSLRPIVFQLPEGLYVVEFQSLSTLFPFVMVRMSASLEFSYSFLKLVDSVPAAEVRSSMIMFPSENKLIPFTSTPHVSSDESRISLGV